MLWTELRISKAAVRMTSILASALNFLPVCVKIWMGIPFIKGRKIMASLSANWVTLLHYFFWPSSIAEWNMCDCHTPCYTWLCRNNRVVILLRVNGLITSKYYYILSMYVFSINSVDVGHLGYFLFLLIVTRVTVNMSKYLNNGMLNPLAYAKEWYIWGMW